MADENEVLESWEELDDNEVMDKKLQNFNISQAKEDKKDMEDSNSLVAMKEEGIRTQYAPQVRILKRQSDTNGILKGNAAKLQGTPQKSLQQREAEYMEARMRILGEDYSGADNNCNNSATVVCENMPVKLVKQVEDVKLQSGKVQLLREPKGPDRDNGFDEGR